MKIVNTKIATEFDRLKVIEDNRKALQARIDAIGWKGITADNVCEEWLDDEKFVSIVSSFINSNKWNSIVPHYCYGECARITISDLWKLYQQGNTALLDYLLQQDKEDAVGYHHIHSLSVLIYKMITADECFVILEKEDFEDPASLKVLVDAVIINERISNKSQG